VDRAKAFYADRVGFHVDLDLHPGDDFRIVQLTPTGSGCSIAIGTGFINTPPGSVTSLAHARGSWMASVNGATTTGGQPEARMSRAIAARPAYSWSLTCESYHGPSRRPSGSPAAAITAAANPPYTTSLSSNAPGGDRRAASNRATVVLPEPGGPATTQTGACTRPGYGAKNERCRS